MAIAIKSIIRFVLMKKVSEKISKSMEIKNDKIPDKEKVSAAKVTSLMLIITGIIYAASASGIISIELANTINAIITNNPELIEEITKSFGEN